MLAVMTLLSVANAGGAQEAGPARQAKPIAPLTWVTDADYPKGAIQANEQGTVSYEVQVDATGKARGCKVTGSSGSAERALHLQRLRRISVSLCSWVGTRKRFVRLGPQSVSSSGPAGNPRSTRNRVSSS